VIRVRFTADAVSRKAAGDVVYVAGSVHDLEDDFAKRWIDRDLAVQVPVRPVIPDLQTEPTLPPVAVDPEPVLVAEAAIAETATAIAEPEPAPDATRAPLSLRGRPRR